MPEIFGKNIPTPVLVAGGAGGLVVVYFVWKQHEAASSSASSSDANATDPVTGLPYSEDNQIDPLTGQTYLSEAQQYGSVSAAEQAYSASGSSPYGTSDGGVYTTGTNETPNQEVGGTTYASNSAWDQAATAGLSDLGYSETDVATALGLYLSNQPLTATQANYVQTAIGEYGPPPVGTYTIILAPTTGPTGSGNNPPTTTPPAQGTPVVAPPGTTPVTPPTSPPLQGTPVKLQAPATAPDPVTVTNSGDNVTFTWPAVGGATKYQVDVTGTEGSQIASPTVTQTKAVIAVIGHQTFSYKLRAGNSAGWGPYGASHSYTIATTTKKK
jgi:hypothetical protein